MTAYNPPLYSFSGLDFNPTIFETGQTAAAASSNSSSSFPSGINTDIIRGIGTSDPISLYDTTTSTITFGGTSTIFMNNMSFKDRSINAKTSILPFTIGADTSANVAIGNSADVYTVDLRGNTTAGSGTLFFGNSGINGRIEGNTGSLNLGTSSTTTINIGNTTTSVINVGNLTVTAQEIKGITPANSLSLGSTQSGILIIGNNSNTNRIGSISIIGQTINTLTPATDLTIGTTQTSNIVIGNATYNTQVGNFSFLGNTIKSVNDTGIHTVLQNVTSGSISIGTGLLSTGSSMLGSLTSSNQIGSINVTAQTVNPVNANTNMNICSNQDTGTLVIGTATKPTTLSGNVACSGTLSINGGFKFNTGNLTGGPYFMQTGTYSATTTIAANGVRSVTITYTTAFKASTTPIVLLSGTGTFFGLVVRANSITNSTFSLGFFNAAGSTAGIDYGINYLAIGEKA